MEEETPRDRKPPQEELEAEEEANKGGGEQEGIANNDSLLSIARYSDDDDEDERLRAEANGHTEEEEEKEGGEGENGDDHVRKLRSPPAKRQRLVEIRRDCPYLDTVNRQVTFFFFSPLLFKFDGRFLHFLFFLLYLAP